MALAFGDRSQISGLRQRARSFDGRSSLSVDDATRSFGTRGPNTPPYTPRVVAKDNTSDGSGESVSTLAVEGPREGHLYFPVPAEDPKHPRSDMDHLVAARNLFAFMTGQALVATPHHPSIYSILCNIAGQLSGLGYTNVDGSTFGEAAATSLAFFIDNYGLQDVRNSREKTIESLVLGERLRSPELYTEAFVHSVGKYEAILDVKSHVWSMISVQTRKRMERSSFELGNRKKSVMHRLTDCEFPSLFAGLAASTTSDESKHVNFKAWKSSFYSMRKLVLSYYKDLHGSWPPKASSKRNTFSESGFNRLVLKGLYSDFCMLYDLLVDRENITNRAFSAHEEAVIAPNGEEETCVSALRTMLSEYDRSYPPVVPPIPFDVPRIPTMGTLDAKFHELTDNIKQDAKSRKLKEHETMLLLTKAHNIDSDLNTPFLQTFRAFELSQSKGKNAGELADLRYGQWLFIYVVLQSLPLLVIDVTGVKHSQGVEYFLCQPPLGGNPWMEDANAVKREWYSVEGRQSVVALPSDIINHGVEAVYHRSHCWVAAKQWADALTNTDTDSTPPRPIIEDGALARDAGMMSPLEEPAPPFAHQGTRRSSMGYEYQGFGTGPVANSSMGGQGQLLSPDGVSPHTGSPNPQPRNPSKDRHRHRSSRSRSANRRSIAFGLEQLPLPSGYDMSSQSNASPPIQGGPFNGGGYVNSQPRVTPPIQEESGPSNAGGYMSARHSRDPSPANDMRRGSAHNDMSNRESIATGSDTPKQGAQTFDDIFANMTPDPKDKKRNRKSRIF
jgi:hypothetical protein